MGTRALAVVYTAEFFERLAYYGSVFIVPTFMTVALSAGQREANVAINLIFAISPLSSLFAFRPADGSLGKAPVLTVGLVLYGLGLLFLLLSSLPSLYTTFPGHPRDSAWATFICGILLLSVGYGAFKTCSAPLVSDALDSMDVDTQRPKYFLFYAWIVNVGALVGILISPFLRHLSPMRARDPDDATSVVATAYYISFAVCAVASLCGLVVVLWNYSALRALRHIQPMSPSWVADVVIAFTDETSSQRKTVHACKIFMVLPFFWLVQNQYMSNVMFQVQWTSLPRSLPAEFFNNINTISMLIGIVAFQLAFQTKGVVPSQRSRMLLGFALVAISMAYCAVIQWVIEDRGYFAEGDDYVVMPGRSAVSAWAFVPPYIVSGLSSALIDPTTLEAAFQRAPTQHKSLVMALYLVAASLAGFLGIAISPLATPRTLTIMYGTMSGALAASALWWRRVSIVDMDVNTKLDVN
jgi:dipeptide/tripeptide permease